MQILFGDHLKVSAGDGGVVFFVAVYRGGCGGAEVAEGGGASDVGADVGEVDEEGYEALAAHGGFGLGWGESV